MQSELIPPAVPHVLVLAADTHDTAALHADLEGAGFSVQGRVPCARLLVQALREPPDVVVAWQPQLEADLLPAVAQLQSAAPCPVLVFTNEVQAEAFERALQSGVSAWVVQGYAAARLRPLVQQALLRFRHERHARDTLVDLSRRYEERTLVDRAKGVLMRALGVEEERAFALMRQASMASHQRLGEVARQVVDVSRDADAVNRAGQLRMVSQRLVKLQALRLAGVDAAGAQALQRQSLDRAEEHLVHLARVLSAPTFGDLVDAARDGLDAVRASLQTLSVDGLRASRDAAQRWLQQADRLVQALQAARQAVPLHVINLAGRQRMLSQRIAQQALLSSLLPPPEDAAERFALSQSREAFEAALAELAALPLTTPQIAAGLAEAQALWRQLAPALEDPGLEKRRREIAAGSEALLALFETLTARYEQGMQRLSGEPRSLSPPAN